ncbi:MAG: cell division FtsZ family protein [Opitutales bacterium]|nr:cell division FtsZ family protein [Opitutales bacterium]
MNDPHASSSGNRPGDPFENSPLLRIKVVGVGGAGTNVVDRMRMCGDSELELAVVGTARKCLVDSPVPEKVMIGAEITCGFSAGGDVDLGRKAAEADRPALQKLFAGVDLVFLVAGVGRGTGSGAAPVVAEEAAKAGALVVGFVLLPFSREGSRRARAAEEAVVRLRNACHCVIALPNDLISQHTDEETSILEALGVADEWIRRGTFAIASMVRESGLINVDFATLRQAFPFFGGKALFGLGRAEGAGFVEKALQDLALCPLLHLPDNRYVRRTDSLILHLRGGPDLTMTAVNRVMDFVTEKFGCRDNTVLGAVIDSRLKGKLEITIIGTVDVTGARRPPANVTHPPRAAAHSPASFALTPPAPAPAAREPILPPPEPELPDTPAEIAAEIEEPDTPEPVAVAAESERDSGFIDFETGRPVGASAPAASQSEGRGKRQAANEAQCELPFPGEEEARGHFESTARYDLDGQDLDVPTFIRRHVRIALH